MDKAKSQLSFLIQCAREEYSSLLKETSQVHTNYAHKHNLQFIFETNIQKQDHSPYWDRIYFIQNTLRVENCEFIVVIDSDTLIVNSNIDLRRALSPNAWLGMVAYPPGGRYPKSQMPYLHSGVMFIRNSSIAREFFTTLWAMRSSIGDDNTGILTLLQKEQEKWGDGVVVLEEKWNTLFGSPHANDACILAWHGLGSVEERRRSIAQVLAGIERRELSFGSQQERGVASPLLQTPSNPLASDPLPAVNFKGLLQRPLMLSAVGDHSTPLQSAALEAISSAGSATAKSRSSDVTLVTQDVKRVAPAPKKSIRLKGTPDIELVVAPENLPQAGSEASVEVASSASRPPKVLLYPWDEFLKTGPTALASPADEIWVASRFERDTYVHLGVPAENIKVILPGVEPREFSSTGGRMPLPTPKKNRLLFLGELHPDQGADLLLVAYQHAFKRGEDVSLIVVSDTKLSPKSPLLPNYLAAASNPQMPEILILDDPLDESKRAALYRSCRALLMPVRRHSNPVVMLEAAFCGLPTIAPIGGSSDDFLDDQSSFRVPAHRIIKGELLYLECGQDALIHAMQTAVARPDLANAFGRNARERVAEVGTRKSWSSRLRERIARLVEPKATDAPPAKLWVVPETGPPSSTTAPPSAARSGSKRKPTLKASRPLLSLCMIVRDEEERIGQCLESIRPFVDEMILVDTGSKDQTREICAALGAKVYDFPWTESFSEARNQSLELASGEWLFWMDADDVISPECGAKLKALIAQHPNKDAAFQVQVRIPAGENEHAESVVDHVKLFPNRPDCRFEFRIHEQILPALRKANIAVHFSDVYVTHRNYDRSTAGQTKKRLRDFRLLELDLKERPNHPFILFNLGMTHLFATKDFEVAAQYLQRCLAGSHPGDSIVRKAYALLTTARLCQRSYQQALSVNGQGRQHYPDDPELLYQAGQIYAQTGNLVEAKAALECLVENGDPPPGSPLAQIDSPRFRSVSTGFSSFLGMYELALVCLQMGAGDRAEALLRRILRDYPHFSPAHQELERLLPGQFNNYNDLMWEMPKAPRIAVYYHCELEGEWQSTVKEQIGRLKVSGLFEAAAQVNVSVVGSSDDRKKLRSLLPRSNKVVFLDPDPAYQDKGQYQALTRLYTDGLASHYDLAWYFHVKGILTPSDEERSGRCDLEHNLLDNWQEGAKAMIGGHDVFVGDFESAGHDGRWCPVFAGNFFATRGDYVRCLPPIIYKGSSSNEGWIGLGNPRIYCPRRIDLDLAQKET